MSEFTGATTTDRRLIETWLPVNELSIEAIRERAAVSALPPINWLHVWWARRPLVISRAAVAASLLLEGSDHIEFCNLLGIHSGLLSEQRRLETAKAQGARLKDAYSRKRAFTFNPTPKLARWMQDNLVTSDPLILDITAGGGSIPFEAGRLGLRSCANDLNPVAGLILRATCQWPQKYGNALRNAYAEISTRYQCRVAELLEGVYPQEPQAENDNLVAEKKFVRTVRPQRYDQTYLWGRTVRCPSCNGEIPLSPNWRLTSEGTGIRLQPDIATGTCGFAIVNTASEQSPGTVKDAIATCPYPNCGATTPRGYISKQAQSGDLGHRLYAVIYRDQWQEYTKSGRPKKNLTTRRGFRPATPEDDNTSYILRKLDELQPHWEAADILPNEPVPFGNDRRPHNYGMSPWRNMFSPRQQLAHGCCVQAFQELVDSDQASGKLDEIQQAAWCYVGIALDKLINRNSLLTRWVSGKNAVIGTFDSHDFGMKWSYAEMAVTIRGLGLEWAIDEVQKCITELIKMSGFSVGDTAPQTIYEDIHRAKPTTEVTSETAELLMAYESNSVDAIIFDPPYYDNVSYAELSDFFYVWLKRTAGYIHPHWFEDYLTDKTNEAIASQARFRQDCPKVKGTPSVKKQAYEDYVARMCRIFAECRRAIKDDGIMTIMFTHKSTEAWDALTIGIIEAGFCITATWPVKTESDSSLNIRNRAAARSTILLTCRPKGAASKAGASWEQVEKEVAKAVGERLPLLEGYDLRPLDIYLASFGPALEVISQRWPIHREMANPSRPDNPFGVTPNDALQVARQVVLDARRRRISDLWAEHPGDPLTDFFVMAQDSSGTVVIPFDEANLLARCIGLELDSSDARRLFEKKGGNIRLYTSQERLASGLISHVAPTAHVIDRVHTAIALAASVDVNTSINWCQLQGFSGDPLFRGTLEALLRLWNSSDPDREPASTLWSEMYSERPPEPEGMQPELPFFDPEQ